MRSYILFLIPVSLYLLIFFPFQAWGCAGDPRWQNTLRCQAYPNADQTPPPMPVPPQSVDEIKHFTRVDLPARNSANEILRCVDGTRPIIYVDAADEGPSNDWLITLQGGGSCHDGESCLNAYLSFSEAEEMGTALQPAMKNMQGINGNSSENKFKTFNRIRIHKCGYDRYNGNAVVRGESAMVNPDLDNDGNAGQFINDPTSMDYDSRQFSVLEGDTLTFDLFHQGKKHMLHTLDQLESGLGYATWVEINEGVLNEKAVLPPLKDARTVLIAGHSGAANGLMHNIDDLVDYMSLWTRTDGSAFNADVRALFDAHLLPSVENEASFTDALSGDVYDHQTQCQQPDCKGGPPLQYTWDADAYFSSGGSNFDFFEGPYQTWNTQLDSSCLAEYPGEEWRCADRLHVLFNHISTPFFIREDFRDPSGQHNNNPAGPENGGHRLFWADAELRHCSDPFAIEPCLPVLSQADFRVRLEEQASRLANDFSTRSDLALSGATIPTIFVWLPDCASHAGAFDLEQFLGVKLESELLMDKTNMHDFLWDFLASPPNDVFEARIDGDADYVSLCSAP